MRLRLVIFLLAFVFWGCAQKKNTEESETKNMKTAIVYTTAHHTNLKLSLTDTLQFKPANQIAETEANILVNPNHQFQTLVGIGAALTDASAETFYKLSKANQDLFMQAYFNPEKGIGYSLARTSIHSCDFSSESYTYVSEGDKELKSFSVQHDKTYRIPFIKRSIDAARGKLKLFASPWSPPAFMKTNNNMLQGGKLKAEFFQPWANYYVKFIQAYQKEGIPIWGLSIQNEPLATQRWESCIYTAEEERDFLKNYLGPTLEKEGLGDKKIIVWDHNRDLIFQRASVILDDPQASKYVWGVGFHWYEDWKDGKPMFKNVGAVHEAYPDKKLIFTEGTNEGFDTNRMEDPKLAERYGKSMINDFNNGTVAWTDWNILLDETGGPNHVGNLCFAPVIGNTKTDKLLFTYEYYYIGHFSKFIRPQARRISSVSTSNNLISTAFQNKDGSMAVVVMNPTENTMNYSIALNSKSAVLNTPPHSIQTIVFNSKDNKQN
jgi:glucosylceramidase